MNSLIAVHTRGVPAVAVAAALLVLLPVGAAAQHRASLGGGSSLAGEISSGGIPVSGLIVELFDLESHRVVDRVSATLGGGFEFRDLRPGSYELRVTGSGGTVVCRDLVTLTTIGHHVTLRLPEQRREQPVSGTVSLARLRHKVPVSAQREVERALAAEKKGEREASVAHFEKAIAIDPGWMEARNSLGARYLRLNRFEQAVEQFREALALDQTAALVHANLGVAYLHLRRFPEAEQAARQGLRYDSTSYRSRYVLGLALDMEGRKAGEALENLTVAARQFPRARVVAAHILVREGERVRAVGELKEYLRSHSAEDRQAVEAWLAKLEEQLVARSP